MLLSSWEVVPKFYQTAISEVAEPLFIGATKHQDKEKNTVGGVNETKKIDYQELTKGFNTDGA